MKTYSNTALPCAVFGHNYSKTNNNDDRTSQLTCNQCGIVVNTDIKGNFEHISSPNKHIQATLRKLYHLKLQKLRTSLAY